MRLVAGVDEAGRGPAIGPMVIAGISVAEADVAALTEAGARDSKKLSPKRRESLVQPISHLAKSIVVEIIPAEVIDVRRGSGNINDLEAESMCRIIRALRPNVAQVGSIDRDPNRFRRKITDGLPPGVAVFSVHHAEDLFPAVAAASIIAKTTRDRIIRALHEEFGDFGSGYPSDPKTRNFLQRCAIRGDGLPRVVRASWKTTQELAQRGAGALQAQKKCPSSPCPGSSRSRAVP